MAETRYEKIEQPWKILVTHKPPYFTNPFGGNAIMKEKLPPVVDELGIDIVFSGHDHSYGRTKKLKDGKEDPNGTVYVVAGTTGQKHYDAVADEKFDLCQYGKYCGFHACTSEQKSNDIYDCYIRW